MGGMMDGSMDEDEMMEKMEAMGMGGGGATRGPNEKNVAPTQPLL